MSFIRRVFFHCVIQCYYYSTCINTGLKQVSFIERCALYRVSFIISSLSPPSLHVRRFLLNSSSNTTRMPTRPHSSSPWKRCCLVWSRRGGLTWSTSTPFTPDSKSGTHGSTPHRYLTRLTSLPELHLSIAFLFLSFLCFCCLLKNYLFCIVFVFVVGATTSDLSLER